MNHGVFLFDCLFVFVSLLVCLVVCFHLEVNSFDNHNVKLISLLQAVCEVVEGEKIPECTLQVKKGA